VPAVTNSSKWCQEKRGQGVRLGKIVILPVFSWNIGSLSKADGIHGFSQSPAVTNSIYKDF
jgi:hypothetical protein